MIADIEKLRGLQSRHAELTAAMDVEELTAPSTDELEAMRAAVQHAMEHGPNTLRMAVLQQFVVEVRIESRRVIWPTFRLPLGGVRELSVPPSKGWRPAGESPARASRQGSPVAKSPVTVERRSRREV